MELVKNTPQQSYNSRDVSHIEKRVISGMEFMSIGDELWRQYSVPAVDGKVYYVRISSPQWLFVRPSKAHMVLDANGVMHYIPAFIHLSWQNRPDAVPANF